MREEAIGKAAAAERRAQLEAQVKELDTQAAAAGRQVEQLRRQMQPLEAEHAQRAKCDMLCLCSQHPTLHSPSCLTPFPAV